MDRRLLEYRPEIDALESPGTRLERQTASFARSELQEAVELLGRADEGELEGYLVELIDRVGRHPAHGVSAALAGILGRAARSLLRETDSPRVIPKGRVFGLELEGLSSEDQTFEVARHFVRFASEAARRASDEPGVGSPQAIAQRAASLAARALAPGLLPALAGAGGATGVWFRRGRQLVVLNP